MLKISDVKRQHIKKIVQGYEQAAVELERKYAELRNEAIELLADFQDDIDIELEDIAEVEFPDTEFPQDGADVRINGEDVWTAFGHDDDIAADFDSLLGMLTIKASGLKSAY